jgi:hypothetical protein
MSQKYNYKIGDIHNLCEIVDIFRENGTLKLKTKCAKCGKTKTIRSRDFHNDKNTSCICQLVKHGLSESRIYSIYHNMKDRCYNPNCQAYRLYGEKGVRLDNDWLGEGGFANFYKWSIDNGYNNDLTIDRINSEGNYEPSNCQWITLGENTARANKTYQHRRANAGTYFAYDPSGNYFEFDNASEFARKQSLNANMIREIARDSLLGKERYYHQWKFGYVNNKSSALNITSIDYRKDRLGETPNRITK